MLDASPGGTALISLGGLHSWKLVLIREDFLEGINLTD